MATKVAVEKTETQNASVDGPLLDALNAEVKKMMTRGRERGYVTYDELNTALPPDQVSSEQIEDTMSMLSEAGINVVENEETEDTDTESGEKEQENISGNIDENDVGRSDDPVRMYLREMGTISLLTREGEVEIAKRIEEGQYEVIAAVANCSVTVNEILNIGDLLKKNHISVFEIIEVNEPEEKKEKLEVRERKKVLKYIQLLKTQKKKIDKLRIRLENSKLSEKMRSKLSGEEGKQRKMLEKTVCDVNLSPEELDRIIEMIYEVAAQIREAGKQEKHIERQLGTPFSEVRKLFKGKKTRSRLPSGKDLGRKKFEEFNKISQKKCC